MTIARSPAEVIAGEAVSGSMQDRWNDMLNIASTMYNRSMMTGVPISDISSVTSQYNAYGHPLPAGTVSYVGLAQQALDYVAANGPVNNSTFYATPAAVNNLPPGLQEDATTKGHVYFSDPQFRSILTTQGYVTPDPSQLGVTMAGAPVPEARPVAALNGYADLANAPTPSYPDLQQNGILSAMFTSNPTQPVDATPSGLLGTQNLDASAKVGPSLLSNSGWQTMANPGTPLDTSGWQAMADAGPMGGYPADPMERMGPSAGPVAYGTSDIGSGTGIQSTLADRMGISVPSVPANDWSAMAAAGPVQTPVNAPVASTGLMSSPITGNLGTVSQQGLLNGTINALNASQQQALSTPMLSQAMNPSYPTLSAPVDVGQLSANSPFATPAIDPSVNAAVNSLANSYSAATPTTDRFAAAPSTFDASRFGAPDITAGMNQSIANSIAATPQMPSVSSIAPTSTGLLSSYQNTPAATPGQAAISGILSSPTPSASSVAPFMDAPVKGPFDTAVTNAFNSFTPAKVMDTPLFGGVVNPSVPSLETGDYNLGVQTPDYQNIVNASFPASIPSIAAANSFPSVPSATMDSTVPGPATTAATTQQAISPPADVGVTTQAAPTHSMFNKGTLIGGLLGGAVAGPVGGIIGGLLGNKINQNGLSGILGSSPQVTPNNIGGGLMNVASVYGGAPPGTQAMTNNGGMVTSLGGGWTSYTNPYGVTESVSPWGGYAADWSGGFNGSRGPVGNGQPGGGGAPGGAGLY